MSRRTRSRNAYESQLAATLASGGSSVDVDSASGLVAPCYLVLAPNDAAKREFIEVGNIATNTLSGIVRNLDGSAPGAPFEHASGTIIRAVPTHQHLDDIFLDIEDLEQADTDHFGGTDTSDHPEASTGVRGFMSAADKSKLNGIDAGAQADHPGLSGITADDHHAQSHSHDGADGSGTVAHGDLTGVGTDDHHAQDHSERHAPGGADAISHEVERFVTESAAALSTSYADIMTLSISIPGSWGGWRITVHASFGISGDETDRADALIRINGVDQQESDDIGAGILLDYLTLIASDQGSATGNVAVSLRVREQTSGLTTLINGNLYARAVRTS